MVIDIKRTVIRTQLRRLITIILFTLIILLVVLTGNVQNTFIGINKYQWALILALVYSISIIFESALEMNYIYFADKDDIIMLRYFSMSLFSKKKNSIEIPKKAFGGYQLIISLWGMKKRIILYHKIKDKEAKYPPVSISSLNKKQINQLTLTLDKYK
ncbi:MAG: hypothetical protein PVF73_10525 [Bacteroidales bacterium]|jgi:hypothetical protein